jgi:hypothetical protein
MEVIKQTLFTNWHAMRWIRLGFGLFLAVQAFQMKDGFAAAVAAFFLYQAVTNTGCCGTTGCATSAPPTQSKNTGTEEIQFEEVTHQKNN